MTRHRLGRIPAPAAETWLPLLPAGRRSGLFGWLADPGSLIRRLRQSGAHVELKLLRQGASRALPDEYPLLGLPQGRKVWRRDVLLIADGTPRVLGHSVCPLPALHGPWRLLLHLGVKPMGDTVFSRPRTRRSALRVAPLRRRNALRLLVQASTGADAHGLWARRSAFVFQGHALWVSEVFLA
jgi:chorismate--pyruvate lyase